MTLMDIEEKAKPTNPCADEIIEMLEDAQNKWAELARNFPDKDAEYWRYARGRETAYRAALNEAKAIRSKHE